MTRHIGGAGRRARELALGRVRGKLAYHTPEKPLFPVRTGPLPLVQRVAPSSSAEAGATGAQSDSPPASDQAPTAIKRETRSPSPEEVANRVYDLFCQDMRWGRERERPLVSSGPLL